MNQFKVKVESVGKIRLENGHVSVILDERVPQDVLGKLFESEVGKEHIELVPFPQPAEK